MGKIIFFAKKYPRNHQNGYYTTKITKIPPKPQRHPPKPQNVQKNTLRNVLIDQNSLEMARMTGQISIPRKRPKYPKHLK